jgi:hypothetical protein
MSSDAEDTGEAEQMFKGGTKLGILALLFAGAQRLQNMINAYVADRAAAVRAAWHVELRRTADTVIYSLLSAFFICSAAAVGALALMLAFWDTHRVLVASSLAAGFLVLAVITLTLLRRGTR